MTENLMFGLNFSLYLYQYQCVTFHVMFVFRLSLWEEDRTLLCS